MKLSFSSSSTTLSLLFLVLVFGFSFTAKALVKLPPNVTVPAVIVFGDSIVDAGNNNNLRTVVKCNFPPYGSDFDGGPTGRFSDGKVPSDLIAEELGVKGLVPAYLDPNLKPQDLLTGVTFASGGTGYDPLTSKIVSVISLADQIQYFKEYLEKLKAMVGVERTNFILANSLFLLVAGSNDIANTYFVLNARKQYDINAYTDLMLNSATDFLHELYGLGARRIGVLNLPPLGCLPSQRTLIGGILRGCAEKSNQGAILFNSKLSSRLNSLTRSLPNSKIVYVDIYSPLFDLIQNPQKYGFKVVNEGCCGTGKIEVAILCNPLSPSICPDASRYVFWDSYHPTERAYRVTVSQLIDKYVYKFF